MAEIFREYAAFLARAHAVILTLVFLLVLAGVVTYTRSILSLRYLRSLYHSAKLGGGSATLDETLARQAEEIRLLTERVSALENEQVRIKAGSRRHLQRWMLERYRAFKDVGGDQSFSLVLLDEDSDGVVLTSIYGRDESRIFAKRIVRGHSTHPLSEEERKALVAAMRESADDKQEIPAAPANL